MATKNWLDALPDNAVLLSDIRMRHGHDWRKRARLELSDWQLWWGRAVVVGLAVLAGLSVVGFTWLCERAFEAFEHLRALAWWSPLLWTPSVPQPSSG